MTIADNPRKHGAEPYSVAVLHGGPGALGGMGEVAHELATDCGVLEPIQTEATIEGQIAELAKQLDTCATPPVTLIGHSWGAWLAVLLAARRPELVRQLVLVCAGPFEASYAEGLTAARLARLSPSDRARAEELMAILSSPELDGRSHVLAEFGGLMSRTDDYDALPGDDDAIGCRDDIFNGVWPAAAEMRKCGELMQVTSKLRCPVVAIHGEQDPHPWRGVQEPLQRVLPDFTFNLLPRCGHTPWRERHAREAFYKLVRNSL